MDFGDLASKYASARWDKATQPFDDPEGYMNNRLGIDESGNVTPRSTTINYNDDGSQTVTTKHDVTPQPIQQPVQQPVQQPTFNFGQPPTQPVVQPVAPQPVAPQPVMQPVNGQAPFSSPLPNTTGVAPGGQIPEGQIPQKIINDSGETVGYETPNEVMAGIQNNGPINPAVSVPTTSVTPPVTPPVAPPVAPPVTPPVAPPVTPPVEPPVVAPPVQTPTTIPVVEKTKTPEDLQAEHYSEIFHKGQTDPKIMAQLSYDDKAPEYIRKAAAEQHLKQLTDNKDQLKAQKDIEEALKSGNTSDFARMLKKNDAEGSYVKAYLFARLGLNDLAKNEQQKLGAGNSWQSVMGPNGERATINFDGNGLPTVGYNAEGKKLSGDELAKLSSGRIQTKGAQAGSTLYQDPVTKESLSKVDTLQGPVYFNTKGERVLPKGQPYPLNTGSNMDLLRQKLETQLSFVPAQEHNKFISKFNAEHNTDFPLMTPPSIAKENQPPKTIPSPNLGSNQKMSAPVTGGGQMIPAINGPVAPTEVSQPPVGMMNAGYNPNGPAGMMNAGYNPNEPGGGMIKTAGPMGPGPSPADIARQQTLETKAGEQEITSEGAGKTETAKEKAKLRLALPGYEQTADNVLTTINDVINHPGFEISVGGSEPIGSFLAKVPGTSARDWRSKYKQLQGQEFLAAFQSLKGGGSISEVEGAKATEAIAALQDPGISEGEFKRNAKLLEDTVKKGINRQREQIGLKPKYEIETNEQTKTINGVTYVFDGKGWKVKK